MPELVRAAGGVVWRYGDAGVEVALVHRPRYDDWSLPKGKLQDGESELEAAVREVREEVGADVALTRRLEPVEYRAPDGRKRVTYWVMRWRGGAFAPNDEVDLLLWRTPVRARETLSYDVDRTVLDQFAALPVPDSQVLLLRHAKAGKRSEWDGPDDLRPLDPSGIEQAERLARLLSFFGPTRAVSAERVRCVDSVKPLAAALDLQVRVDPVFNDESYDADPQATQNALLALAKPGAVTVVCSQGEAIPGLIGRLRPGVTSPATRKAAWWVLGVLDGEVITADYYDAA